MRFLILASLLVVGTAGAARAQVPGIDLSLFPRIGAYKPTGELAELASSSAELRGGPAIGLSAELKLPLLPFSLRGNLEYVLNTNGAINDVELDSDNSILLLSADLVFRLLPAVVPVQPYLLAGGGFKKYDFDNSFATSSLSFEDQDDFTVHLGAGLGIKLGPLSLVGEVSDYVSRFNQDGSDGGKFQNDLFAMIGIKLGLF